MTEKSFDPKVWGPHFWFFIMTMAISYPLKANETTKKKYYDFIQNLPLLIPHPEIGNKFSKLLDEYPISPYLEGKDSFIKWVHFIHNKVNIMVGKDEITLTEALEKYHELYKPKEIIVDGSNFKSCVRLWEASCRKQKIPFHYTNEKGFYRFNSD